MIKSQSAFNNHQETTTTKLNNQNDNRHKMMLPQLNRAQSEIRNDQLQQPQNTHINNAVNMRKVRSVSSSFDIKSLDRLSQTSSHKRQKSLIGKLRTKLTGANKMKSNVFDETLIMKSIRILCTKTSSKLSLEDASLRQFFNQDLEIKDSKAEKFLKLNESIEKGVVKFFHPINNFEFKYAQSCYIFNESFLFLVNYVIDSHDKAGGSPGIKKKIGLRKAFNTFIIDKENAVYFSKRGPINLTEAIEKGYISCEVIDLSLVEQLISSYAATNQNILNKYEENNFSWHRKYPINQTPQSQEQQEQQDKIDEKEMNLKYEALVSNKDSSLNELSQNNEGLSERPAEQVVQTEIKEEDEIQTLKSPTSNYILDLFL
jgi:hypothetical protein